MSDYRRFISYIYAYERDIKSKNVGFAKVEVRNGECRISISIKGAFAASEKGLSVYLFYREGQELPGICLGSFPVKNGAGEFHCVTDAENISDMGKRLEDMCGIILCHEKEDSRMYASGWDDLAIVPWKLVIRSSHEPKREAEVLTAEEIPVIAAVEAELKRLESDEEERLEVQAEQAASVREEAVCVEQGAEPELLQEIQKETDEEWQSQKEYGVGREQPAEQVVHKGLWERLEDSFPKIIAFEDEPELECLKIDLKDLENLPRENWGLANNSFLLHGYYNFRYLILGKLKEDEYMLGVPGMFHNNERFLAAMFGFEYFKAVKEYKPLTGHFGYWYRRVLL